MTPLAFLERSPDTAVLACTLGTLLIYIELNRPGMILPGAIGLLLLLSGVAALSTYLIWWPGVALLAFAVLVLLAGLRRKVTVVHTLLTAVAIAFGCALLVRGPGPHVGWPTAIVAGTILGAGTSILTAIARRARTNKGLD